MRSISTLMVTSIVSYVAGHRIAAHNCLYRLSIANSQVGLFTKLANDWSALGGGSVGDHLTGLSGVVEVYTIDRTAFR